MGRGCSILMIAILIGSGAAEQRPVEFAEDAPLEVELRGNRIVFNHRIEFAHDSDRILPESHEILDRVAELLATHESIIRIQVQGHSSTDGDVGHNRELSNRRAEAVAEYLRAQGVTQEVTSQGYGETYPLCTDDSPECHARNRRVEFFVDER